MCFYKNEKWARVNGYYFLSNYGRWFNLQRLQIIKQHPNNNGYLRINVGGHNDKRFIHFTHIKVVELFGDCNGNKIPQGIATLRELGLSIDHRDGNKKNNMQSNLELVTHSVNCERIYNKPIIDKKLARRTKDILKTFEECF